jgi:hypothetical protein
MSAKGLSRRGFLKAAVAAAAAPYGITSSALGGGGRLAASERVTMGFIGVGNQGGGHLFGTAWTYLPGGYLARPDVQVLGVCDVQKGRREGAVGRCNKHYASLPGAKGGDVTQGYVDFREMLARPDIDAVLIGTPIWWHSMMTIYAAKAGKDIYCEKPTGVNVRESQAMRNAVKRYGRVYQGGTQQRSEYGGVFRLGCELVRSGRIGKLKEIWCYCEGGGATWSTWPGEAKPPADLDWDLYLGPAPYSCYRGAGAHMFGWGGINWGQHHHDIVQWAADADNTGPVEFSPRQAKYASGVTVYFRPYPDPTIGIPGGMKFAGEGGCVFVGAEGRIAVDRRFIVSNPAEILRRKLGPDDVRLYRSTSHSGNFLECVRSRKETICNADSTHRAASLMLLAGIADQLGKALKWDPAAEKFGDEEANQRLLTTYRPPWNIY